MQILRRIDRLRRGRRRLADQTVVDGWWPFSNVSTSGQPVRPIAGADDADMGVAGTRPSRSSS